MKLIADLKDDQYPFTGVDHVREVVRAVLLNDKNQVCLHFLFATDMFGLRQYYETPGGGVNPNESHHEALKREIIEEVGYESTIIGELGEVDDYYNLIKRRNHNYFYLARIGKFVGKHQEQKEKELINKTIWVDIDEAILLYKNMQNVLVGKLVKQRELPILLIARETIKKL